MLDSKISEPYCRRRLGIAYFIHPVPLASVALLALNDHVLKRYHPSVVTGKLSDFAGLFFFPILLCAFWNLGRSMIVGKPSALTTLQITVSMAATDLIFIGVKFVPIVTQIYLQFSRALGFPSRVTLDWSDLIALSVNVLTWKFAKLQIVRQFDEK